LKRVTPGPTASTTPAASIPTRWLRGARTPEEEPDELGTRLDPVEIRPVDGRDVDANEDLAIARDRRLGLLRVGRWPGWP
jgi:hypothetical protein